MTFDGKKILLGITGSIAAYKSAGLIRLFKKEGADVKVVSTETGLLFIGEKTLETLSNNPVYVDMFQKRGEAEHISLADWADIFVIAPISANTISKISLGIADNLLTSVACAFIGKQKPVFIAPAMNEGMWNNKFVQENISKLKNSNVKIIDPIEGELACGYNGVGKMREPFEIVNFIKNSFENEALINKNTANQNQNKHAKKRKILITAGGTREYIDPVRFITNASSGKTGLALADCAYDMGYEVSLISTFEVDKPYKVSVTKSAKEMYNAVIREFKNADYLIMAAAVSDFSVKNYKNSKIKKEEIKNDSYTIELGLNPDILKYIAQNKNENQKVIGFSLSTEDVVEWGRKKLYDKKCDYIVANDAKTALDKDNTEVWVICDKETVKIENAPKKEVAKRILEIVL